MVGDDDHEENDTVRNDEDPNVNNDVNINVVDKVITVLTMI